MSIGTNIEWTDATWSPLLGCSPASAGCAHCYAVRDTWRLAHNPNRAIREAREGLVEKTSAGVLRWTGTVRLLPDLLDEPLHWKKPRRIFVANQADLFHEDVPNHFIRQVFEVMAKAPQHTFQVLTKRADRLASFLPMLEFLVRPWPLPNVWLGVSVENQAAADERIPHLLATPAAVRFLSCEPLLGPVDLGDALTRTCCRRPDLAPGDGCDGPGCNGTRIDWVIVGGESGPVARACDVVWIRSIVEQCRRAGVPTFVKQLGAHIVASGPAVGGWPIDTAPGLTSDTSVNPTRIHVRDRKGGDPAEWPIDLRCREMPR